MFKTHFLYGNASQKLFFKYYFNKLTKIKAISKRSCFKSELRNHQDDTKKKWRILQKFFSASRKAFKVTTILVPKSAIYAITVA